MLTSPVIRTRCICVLMLFAVLATGASASAAHPDRIIGIGWNVAAGASLGKPLSVANFMGLDAKRSDEFAFDLELACLELRIFPGTDRVSIDLQWDLVQSFAGHLWWGDHYVLVHSYLQNTYVHIHFDPDARAAFALAPGLVFAAAEIIVFDYFTIGAACRVGVDLTSGDKKFGLGIYARPALFGSVAAGSVHGGYERLGFEVVGELTWTFYVLRK